MHIFTIVGFPSSAMVMKSCRHRRSQGDLEFEVGEKITRIALDAPLTYAEESQGRREAEKAMDRLGISVFATPTKNRFREIIVKAKSHLDGGGKPSDLPHANQIWMLVGFDLFEVLSQDFKCLEVYPQAIVRQLGVGRHYKKTVQGHHEQLMALAKASGLSPDYLRETFPQIGFGARHDRLDALMAAWVASLKPNDRIELGKPPDDVIWVPRAL